MAGAPKTLSFFLLYCLLYVHARDTVQQESQRKGDNRKESIFVFGLYQLQCKYKRIVKCKIAIGLGKATNLKRPRNSMKAMVLLLLLICGDVESNPGPRCNDCKVSQGSLCQGDLFLCQNCEQKRFPPKEIKKMAPIKEGSKKAKSCDDEIVITDEKSIIKNYRINTELLLAPVHNAEQKKKFEGHSQPYLFETIPWKNLPAFILAAYQVIYHGIGIDDNYFVYWTDLKSEESCDEIEVKIEKNGETGKKTEWVTIFIHIPTSSIAIIGPGLTEFAETILLKIKEKQGEISEHNETSRNQEITFLHTIPPNSNESDSHLKSPDTNKPTVALNNTNPKTHNHTRGKTKTTVDTEDNASIWAAIDKLQKDMTLMKNIIQPTGLESQKNKDTATLNNQLIDENDRLTKENNNLKKELQSLKNQLAKKDQIINSDQQYSHCQQQQQQQQRSHPNLMPYYYTYTPAYSHTTQQSYNPNLTSFGGKLQPSVIPRPNLTTSNRFSPLTNLSDMDQQYPKQFPLQQPTSTLNSHSRKSKEKQQNPAKQPLSNKHNHPNFNPNQYHQNKSTNEIGINQHGRVRNTDNEKETIVIIGDSMIKDIQPHKLARTLNKWVNKVSISGMKLSELKHYLQPSLSKKPAAIIIHCGINDLMQSVSLQHIHQEIESVINSIKGKLPKCEIYLSSVIHQTRNRNLHTSVDQLNTTFNNICNKTNSNFIDNDNISEDSLNNSGLHLNKKGTARLACNFRDCSRAEY